MNKRGILAIIFSLLMFPNLSACGQNESISSKQTFSAENASQIVEPGRLEVVATTSILGDVVAQIGGDVINLSVLLPAGSDPHTFEPTPQDIAKVADADVVFINGIGLERFLDSLIQSAGAEEKVISVSAGVNLIDNNSEGEKPAEEEQSEGESHVEEGADPHVWTDPNNVLIWIENIKRELSELDKANAELYERNTSSYEDELKMLDTWIRQQVAEIDPEKRKIVTDHIIFSYFCNAYGFTQVGAIIPGYSVVAEPSARELASLEDKIQELGVKAVFVGNTFNPNLAVRLTEDTGTQLIYLYTGSLSEKGGDADTYLDYIRYNVKVIVETIK